MSKQSSKLADLAKVLKSPKKEDDPAYKESVRELMAALKGDDPDAAAEVLKDVIRGINSEE